ncbi:DUF317 domain-containing protein [Streptomyces sp. NPDC047081]|uniref:DUF317 domain-containing protein n=1 Tax=Streptomyces sp. NPDC047081 TaxID=3154706 RepID=UPI0033F38E47
MTERQLATFRHDHESHFLHVTSPRYLAGSGDARHITHALLAAGWSVTSDPACPQTQLDSPDLSARLEVASQFTPSRWWHLTAKPSEATTWSASFSRQVPAEILAGLTDTLLTSAPADAPDPWGLFREANWSVTQSENGTGLEALSPDRRMVVEYSRPLDIEFASFSWRIRAKKYPAAADESPLDGLAVWDGWLNQHTPAHAVAGFITALTSTEPLLRGLGQHGWPFGVQHERTSRTGRVVADAHQQRVKGIQALVRTARRCGRLDAAATTAAPVPASVPTAAHAR